MEIVVNLLDHESRPAARLALALANLPGYEGFLHGEVGLVWGIFEARQRVWFAGYRIADFIAELQRVYETYAGQARLLEEENNVPLIVTGSDRFQGKAEVAGEWTTYGPAEDGKASVQFQGLLLEPEGIATLARQLKSMLHETGIGTRRPSHEQQWPWPAAATQIREWWARCRHRDNLSPE